jgi:hypothetical protein
MPTASHEFGTLNYITNPFSTLYVQVDFFYNDVLDCLQLHKSGAKQLTTLLVGEN